MRIIKQNNQLSLIIENCDQKSILKVAANEHIELTLNDKDGRLVESYWMTPDLLFDILKTCEHYEFK